MSMCEVCVCVRVCMKSMCKKCVCAKRVYVCVSICKYVSVRLCEKCGGR
jgi:hypothetical protein